MSVRLNMTQWFNPRVKQIPPWPRRILIVAQWPAALRRCPNSCSWSPAVQGQGLRNVDIPVFDVFCWTYVLYKFNQIHTFYWDWNLAYKNMDPMILLMHKFHGISKAGLLSRLRVNASPAGTATCRSNWQRRSVHACFQLSQGTPFFDFILQKFCRNDELSDAQISPSLMTL